MDRGTKKQLRVCTANTFERLPLRTPKGKEVVIELLTHFCLWKRYQKIFSILATVLFLHDLSWVYIPLTEDPEERGLRGGRERDGKEININYCFLHTKKFCASSRSIAPPFFFFSPLPLSLVLSPPLPFFPSVGRDR